MTSTRRTYHDKSYCCNGIIVEQRFFGLPQGFVRKCICNEILQYMLQLIINNQGKKIFESRNPQIIPDKYKWNEYIRLLKSYDIITTVYDDYGKNPVYYIKPQYKFGIERILKEHAGAEPCQN